MENVNLPEHLQHQFEEVEVDATGEPKAKNTGEPKAKTLAQMNKAELEAKCAELGIEIPEGATNKQIVELIEAQA
jgi:hypothetical protein